MLIVDNTLRGREREGARARERESKKKARDRKKEREGVKEGGRGVLKRPDDP